MAIGALYSLSADLRVRVLNKRRISSIKNFVLEGNMFFNSFILNWVDKNYPVKFKDNGIYIPQVPAGAQVIDGQHRLEGLKQAIDEKPEIGEQSVIIVLVQNLKTADAARIFLNINTEQKPVPNSLVYDLFGEVRSKDYYILFELKILPQNYTKILSRLTISVSNCLALLKA